MIVVKVGGSLYDMADLKSRLLGFLDSFRERDQLLVPGGGTAADAVRSLDRTHGFRSEDSHLLALRACSLNAHFLAVLLGVPVVEWPTRTKGRAVLDPLAFIQGDICPDALPACWEATSDSVAGRASAIAAAELILLKSVTIPEGMTWRDASRHGFIDPLLPALIERHRLQVRAVNLREVGQ